MFSILFLHSAFLLALRYQCAVITQFFRNDSAMRPLLVQVANSGKAKLSH